MATERVFIPWGEFKPDQGLFAHRDLVTCQGLVPALGNYVAAPGFTASTTTWAGSGATASLGLHAHPTGASTWKAYQGDTTKLWEADPAAAFARTDKSRLVGGAYAAGRWMGTSFGDSVIMTDFVDAPQILLTPATANFVDMPTSTFKPRFKFVTTLKNNVVGANCKIPVAYDTLLAQDYPQLVVWSQNDNATAWGSPAVDPQLVGADFQLLLNDFGWITGVVGGEFVLIAQQRAWVRMEGASGSSFSFRVIAAGTGCRYPRSIAYFNGDVYFWGPSGPSRLRGGEAPVEILGRGKVSATLLKTQLPAAIDPEAISVAVDHVNGLVAWSVATPYLPPPVVGLSGLEVVYNTEEDRFTFFDQVKNDGAPTRVYYQAPTITTSETYLPIRDTVAILRDDALMGGAEFFGVPAYGGASASLPIKQGTGFIQLDERRSTRVVRVRPVYAAGTSPDLVESVQLGLKNKHGDALGFGPYITKDSHGFLVCQDSKFGDFHQFVVNVQDGATSKTYDITELKGFEVEYQQGPVYAV